MARLPNPGGDNNVWGTILNDYLTTSHNNDGSLKNGVVTNATISGTISQSKVTDLVSDLAAKADASSIPTADTLSGATATGKALLKATDAAVARTAIGAGTSSLTVGVTSGTAAAGDDPRIVNSIKSIMVADPTGVEATDSAAVLAAITTAAGKQVRFAVGTYVLDNVAVTATANLLLDPGTTLLAKPNASNSMFNFTGTYFKLRGGTVDGNKSNQSGRPYIFTGAVQSGKTFDVAGVTFQNTVASVAYISLFAGLASIEHCTFSGQAEHDGTAGHSTTIMTIISGQGGAKGYIRFNHNRAIGTVTPALTGGSPGGIFCAVNGYVAGAPGSEGFAEGNGTTLEAIGNYFYGYGQNCGGDDVSPIHTYPCIAGARIIGNYFEGCGFCAISAKSVQDFECSNNYVVNGQYNAQNVSSEGAISYVPGYQAASISRPRAVITGNIITDPGGESVAVKQNGISVHGTNTSLATDLIIANNVITRAGSGIQIDWTKNAVITGNIIVGASDGAANAELGINFNHLSGDITISDNEIRVFNGNGLSCVSGNCTTAKFFVSDNHITNANNYGAALLGVALAKFSGNTFDATSGVPVYITEDPSNNNTAWLAWDQTNTVLAGTAIFVYAHIDKATGYLQYSGSPVGVVVPGEVGTMYRQTNGTTDGILWYAQDVTSTSWTKIVNLPTAGVAAANRMIAQTFDPALAGLAQTAAAAGVLSLAKVRLLGGGVITNIWFSIAVAGTGLTAGRCFIGVYDASNNLLGTSADMAAVFATTDNKSVALITPTAFLPAGTEVFVGWFWNGSTGPQFRGFNGTGISNIGIIAATDSRYATGGSGYTTALPATCPTKTASNGANSEPWIGVS